MPVVQYFQNALSGGGGTDLSAVLLAADATNSVAASITLDGSSAPDGATMYAALYCHGGVTFSTPAGWTLLDNAVTATNSSGLRGYLFKKTAASEASTTFSLASSSADLLGMMLYVENAVSETVLTETALSNTYTITNVTVADGGCAVQMLGALDDPFVGAITRDSAPTELYYTGDTETIPGELAGVASYESGAGTAGPYDYSQATARWVSFHINVAAS